MAAPLNLQALLKAMLDKGASDLHITAGSPPRLRIDNELVRLQTDALGPVDTKTLCYSVMNDAQKLRFELGKRLLQAKRYEDAVGAFQDAKADPKPKVKVVQPARARLIPGCARACLRVSPCNCA